MSLNQLVDPLHPLDIVVENLTVNGDFDIGTIDVDDLLVTGTLTLDEPSRNGVLYTDVNGDVGSKVLGVAQILIGNGSAAPPTSAPLVASSGGNMIIYGSAGSIQIGTTAGPHFSSTDTNTLTVHTALNFPIASAATGYVLTSGDSLGTATWAAGGIAPSTDLTANSIQLLATSEQIALGPGPSGSDYPLVLNAANGIATDVVTFPRMGIASNVVLSQGTQTIAGTKSFTSATGFTRLDASALGTNNVLITGSPNINASSSNATVIGGNTADAKNYSNSVVIGGNISQTVATMTGNTLVGTSITVDDASSNNVVIGDGMTIAGSNKVVIGGSNTTDFYSMGTNVALGNSTKPFASLRVRDDVVAETGSLVLRGGASSTIFIDDSGTPGSSMTIFNTGFGGDYGLQLPPASGWFLTRDVAGIIAQATSPTTSVTYAGVTVVITTQPMVTAALSTTTFRLINTKIGAVVSPAIPLLTISNYSGTLITNGIPSVIGSAVGGGGAIDIIVINSHPVNALNGTLDICFLLV